MKQFNYYNTFCFVLRIRTVNDTQKGGMVPPDLVGTAKTTFSRLEVYYCVNSSKQRVLFPYCALFFDSGENANYGEIPLKALKYRRS